jgi:hypothetical protein
MTERRIFSYDEAIALLPEAQRLTEDAVVKVEALLEANQIDDIEDLGDDSLPEYQTIVSRWAEQIQELGIEVKGLWLIDFDSGSGYYCWKYPEPALQFYHGYDEGFAGRVQLT